MKIKVAHRFKKKNSLNTEFAQEFETLNVSLKEFKLEIVLFCFREKEHAHPCTCA